MGDRLFSGMISLSRLEQGVFGTKLKLDIARQRVVLQLAIHPFQRPLGGRLKLLGKVFGECVDRVSSNMGSRRVHDVSVLSLIWVSTAGPYATSVPDTLPPSSPACSRSRPWEAICSARVRRGRRRRGCW